MSDKPSIKGSVLKSIVDHALHVCRQKAIPVAELERRLGPGGVQMLKSEILATSWYPVTFYGPLREFLRAVEGGGRDQYTIDNAMVVANKLIASGMYPQLEYLKQWKEHVPLEDPAANARARRDLFESQLLRVSTIHKALFNFAIARVARDPEHVDRLQLEYRDGGVMPHDGRLAVLGFWLEIGLHWSPQRRGGLWSRFDAADHYILKMTRDIAQI